MTQILFAEDHRAMPWANGGGVTAQVATSPVDSDMNSFDWRVSIAQIVHGGPFSELPGVDWVLALIEGQSLQLTIDDTPHCLSPESPIEFAGEAHVECHLPDGPTSDLNLMTRRGRCSGTMHFVTDAVIDVEPFTHDSTLVVITSGDFTYDDVQLKATDALVVDQRATLFGNGTVAVLRISPTAPPSSADVTNGRGSALTSKVVD